MINEVFDKMVYYLPVFVPFSLTVFSVVTRLISGTMELKLRNFLKTYSDIVLGIFSFLVWGLITLLQTGKIKINEDLSIPPAKLLILLILDIILLVIAAVISRHQWTDSSKAIPLTKIKLVSPSKEKIADTVMILITLFFFILPLFLTSPIKGKEHYIVAIPYEDSSIPQHLGSTSIKFH